MVQGAIPGWVFRPTRGFSTRNCEGRPTWWYDIVCRTTDDWLRIHEYNHVKKNMCMYIYIFKTNRNVEQRLNIYCFVCVWFFFLMIYMVTTCNNISQTKIGWKQAGKNDIHLRWWNSTLSRLGFIKFAPDNSHGTSRWFSPFIPFPKFESIPNFPLLFF